MKLLYEILTLIFHFILGLFSCFIGVCYSIHISLLITSTYLIYEFLQSKTIIELISDIIEYSLGYITFIIIIIIG